VTPPPTHRIAVAGASGRMGRMLIEGILADADFALAGALDAPGSALVGHDAGEFLGHNTGILITDDLEAGLANAEVLIDFTRPEGSLRHLQACAARGVRLVIGTTGFDDAGKAAIAAAGAHTGIVFAPNMSVGVNAVFKLLEVAAAIFNTGFDIEIIEAHHRHKVDAPSGTALKMGGVTGERDPSTIGFSTIRGGDIVGDHTVLFAGTGERIEITHRSSSRATYVQGSLRAARFLAGRERGLYDMQDVLGLK
jgi:4-hydroxy-tetrahydrodipicolinate reductase